MGFELISPSYEQPWSDDGGVIDRRERDLRQPRRHIKVVKHSSNRTYLRTFQKKKCTKPTSQSTGKALTF